MQTTVKPADLKPDDRIISVNGYKQVAQRVVRVDEVAPGFVRYIVNRKGNNRGTVEITDYQEIAHPDHDIVVERP